MVNTVSGEFFVPAFVGEFIYMQSLFYIKFLEVFKFKKMETS